MTLVQMKVRKQLQVQGFGEHHQRKSKPVAIRGIVYPSRSEAARQLGVHQSTVAHAIRTGTLDEIGVHNYSKLDRIRHDKMVVASVHMLSGDPERMKQGIADMKAIHKSLGLI